MADRLSFRVAAASRSCAGFCTDAALAVVLLAVPFAVAAAVATLLAGAGLAAAVLGYGLAGSMALLAGSALLCLPRRKAVLGAPARLVPAQAHLVGR